MRYLIIILLLLAACVPAPATEETRPATEVTEEAPATIVPTNTLAATSTIAPTTAPTLTPMAVEDLPALELLGGAADSCTNAEDYGALMAFDVRYYELTTANRLHFRLTDADGNVLTEGDTSGENKDGEEGWGFYPLAYEVPANTILTMEIETYESMEADATLTSRSSISFNCTTGEVDETSFERMGN
jgi:hypothetical protein